MHFTDYSNGRATGRNFRFGPSERLSIFMLNGILQPRGVQKIPRIRPRRLHGEMWDELAHAIGPLNN